jgi:hypothetical protein
MRVEGTAIQSPTAGIEHVSSALDDASKSFTEIYRGYLALLGNGLLGGLAASSS